MPLDHSAETPERILIIGAGGVFGSHVAPYLTDKGMHVRGMVRHEAGEAVARSTGIEDIVYADLLDEAALRLALKDVSRVFYIPPKFLPDEGAVGARLVELAAEEGVSRFVLSGVMHPFLTDMVNHCEKLPVMEALIKSGMNYTILLPTNLMQSIGTFFWHNIIATGKYIVPGDATKSISWVDYRDVAEVAAKALTGDELSYGIFELSAAGMITREDICRMMSDSLGRTITAEHESPQVWAEKHLPPDPNLRAGFKGIGEFYDRYGFPGGNDLVLRTILGREPRNMGDYIAELAATAQS